jgi:tRNA(Ile)-lysidine synthase
MPDLREQVKKTILREQLIDNGDLVIIAVSGGADSLSLLHLLNELRMEKFITFSLYVAHLNHGLRGKQARDDAEFVRQEAKRAGLPCTIGEVDTFTFGKRRRLSLEDAARRLRYRFLEQLAKRIGASRIAVGHTRDDQVETLLLNFLRGTGLDGLSGMKFKRATGAEACVLIRPLLGTSRNEIERYCRQKKLSPRFDETNLDTRFLRNKIRLELLPFLEKEYNPNIRKSLARLSNLLAPDRDFLQDAASRRLSQIISREETRCLELDVEALLSEHEALQGRILRLAISRLTGRMRQGTVLELSQAVPREVDYDHIRAVLNLCREGSPHGVLYLPLGLKIVRNYNVLVISYGEQPRPGVFIPFSLPVPGKKAIPGRETFLQAELALPEELSWPPEGRKEAYLDYDRVIELAGGENNPESKKAALSLFVRTRHEGDLFYPLGAPGKRKLKKYFIDQKIPLKEREQVPLVLAGKEIIWVVGKQISHFCRITEKTKKALVLRLV